MVPTTHRRLILATITLSAIGALPAASQTINEDLKILAPNAAAGFGNSIAIDNGIVAVGARFDDNDNGINSGSAYLFDATTGAQLFKLIPNDGAADDWFGWPVAMINNLVAVGSRRDGDNGINSGSVYLFDASTGEQLFKLLASDGTTNNNFGSSIAIDNGVIAVGASGDNDNGNQSGSAYLFDVSTGKQLFKLLPIDGSQGDNFGYSIAIDYGVVAVGALSDRDNGFRSGSAYLFDASTGKQLFKLLPRDGSPDDQFGNTIDIDNGIVAVGAYRDHGNDFWSGSAYLFDASTGEQSFKLLPNGDSYGDQFGYSIAIDNDIVAVGAIRDDDNGSISGSAYLFDASTGSRIAKLLPSDGAWLDGFGQSIAITNDTVAVGAYFFDDNTTDTGSAYMFTVSCPADLTGDGVLNLNDVSAFITALSNNEPIADFTNDNRWNFFDVSAFLQAFSAGCP